MEENTTTMENKENNSQNKDSNNSQIQIAGAIIIAGLIIGGAILLKGNTLPKNNTENNSIKSDLVSISPDDRILGNKNAKIVIIEYSDLECPFCKVFHETMHRVVQDSNNEVSWVYRQFPLTELHPKAFHEAEAAECAYEQGGNDGFWKYIDRVFEVTPSNNGLDEKELPKIAQYIGLDLSRFNTCLNSTKYQETINKSVAEGKSVEVNGTPFSFILVDGKVVDNVLGAQPYEAVMKRLSELK